jgi:hypothetical protein
MINRARRAAFERGDKTFISGVPCLRGHTGPRYTKSNACIKCRTWVRDMAEKPKLGPAFKWVRRRIKGVPVMVKRFY